MKPGKYPTRRKEARPAGTASTTRRCAVASLAVHVAAIIFMLSVPVARSHRPVFADTIHQVALVEWPQPNFAPPVPAAKGRATGELKPTPPKEKKKVVPPKKKPAPKTEPAAKTSAPAKTVKDPDSRAAAATPAPAAREPEPSPSGVPGAAASDSAGAPVSLGMVDQKDFKHNYYLELVRSLLAREWQAPSGITSPLSAGLHFVIRRDGTLETPDVVTPSGWSVYDRAALRAVLAVKRLPPLPEAYAGDRLGLTVFFQWTGEEP